MSVVFHFARELQGIRNATQTNYRCRQHCEQPMTSRSIFFWRRRLAYRIKRASTFAGPCRNLPLRSQQNADWLLFRHGEYSPPSEYSEISSQNKMKKKYSKVFPSFLPSFFILSFRVPRRFSKDCESLRKEHNGSGELRRGAFKKTVEGKVSATGWLDVAWQQPWAAKRELWYAIVNGASAGCTLKCLNAFKKRKEKKPEGVKWILPKIKWMVCGMKPRLGDRSSLPQSLSLLFQSITYCVWIWLVFIVVEMLNAPRLIRAHRLVVRIFTLPVNDRKYAFRLHPRLCWLVEICCV